MTSKSCGRYVFLCIVASAATAERHLSLWERHHALKSVGDLPKCFLNTVLK